MTKSISFLVGLYILFAANIPATAAPRIFIDPESDLNGNQIADPLEETIAKLQVAGKGLSGVPVIVILYSPPQKEDREYFKKCGGEILHIFAHATYGLAGTIPADAIAGLAQSWGPQLCLIEEDHQLEILMDTTVPQTRARPLVWDESNGYGFNGNPNTTIGFFDTGLDDSHPDLEDKLVFWHDFHFENELEPVDLHGHGTAVAGIACGTGAVYGNEPIESIGLTLTNLMSASQADVPVEIPIMGSAEVFVDMAWQENTPQGCINLSRVGEAWPGPYCSSSSPVSNFWGIDGPGLHRVQVHFPTGFTPTNIALHTVFPYAQRDDGFNLFSGMAPDCKVAMAKVTRYLGDGHGFASAYIAACDSMVQINQQINMKVANGSVAGMGNDLTIATNSIIQRGTVFAVAAGNYVGQMMDIARAENAITVGAVNDFNQLTDFSANGPAGSNKPDVLAPGGNWDLNKYDLGLSVYTIDSNDMDGDWGPPGFPDFYPDDYKSWGFGTSYASPHVAGLAALIIDALESSGQPWGYSMNEALWVKNIIQLTATETNQPRDNNGGYNPPLNRGGKDTIEGYGLINADAAIETILNSMPGATSQPMSLTFGENPSDRRCWATRLVDVGEPLHINLNVASTLDADLYVYLVPPGLNDPVLLASSVNPEPGENESLVFSPPAGQECFLTVKRISGYGDATFQLWATPADLDPPSRTCFTGNYPNPFNPMTTIRFNVGSREKIQVSIFDMAGRLICNLANQTFDPGLQEVVWDGTDKVGGEVASGTYFARLKTASSQENLKVMLVR